MTAVFLNEKNIIRERRVDTMMPLTMAGIGEVNTILKIGGNEETRRFLANLGFVTGTEISVVSAIGGNVIVNVKDARVAVNSDMAKHIMI